MTQALESVLLVFNEKEIGHVAAEHRPEFRRDLEQSLVEQFRCGLDIGLQALETVTDLLDLGCRQGHGFLHSGPIPAVLNIRSILPLRQGEYFARRSGSPIKININEIGLILHSGDRDRSGASSLPVLTRQSSPPIESRGLAARVKHGHDKGSDQ